MAVATVPVLSSRTGVPLSDPTVRWTTPVEMSASVVTRSPLLVSGPGPSHSGLVALMETVRIAHSSFVAAAHTAPWSPVAGIEVQLLGRFLVRRSGEEVPAASFGGRLVRVLVRLLASRRGSFVSRDVMAEALWPERMPADPTANLRVLVQRARAALRDPALIVTGPGGYSFAAGGGCEVDTEIFLARVRDGQDHFATGHAAAALSDFRSALDLWGEPLAEDAYDD